jgi:hypothetical protein
MFFKQVKFDRRVIYTFSFNDSVTVSSVPNTYDELMLVDFSRYASINKFIEYICFCEGDPVDFEDIESNIHSSGVEITDYIYDYGYEISNPVV